MSYRIPLAMFGQNGRCHHEHCRFHPSGDPCPSPQDVRLTQDVARTGKLLGIELLDHGVIGRQVHVSLREQGSYTPSAAKPPEGPSASAGDSGFTSKD